MRALGLVQNPARLTLCVGTEVYILGQHRGDREKRRREQDGLSLA